MQLEHLVLRVRHGSSRFSCHDVILVSACARARLLRKLRQAELAVDIGERVLTGTPSGSACRRNSSICCALMSRPLLTAASSRICSKRSRCAWLPPISVMRGITDSNYAMPHVVFAVCVGKQPFAGRQRHLLPHRPAKGRGSGHARAPHRARSRPAGAPPAPGRTNIAWSETAAPCPARATRDDRPTSCQRSPTSTPAISQRASSEIALI
jgi:hypothetical protein